MAKAVLVPQPTSQKGRQWFLSSIAAAVRPISSYCLDGFPLFSLHRHEPMLLGYLELASGKSDIYIYIYHIYIYIYTLIQLTSNGGH